MCYICNAYCLHILLNEQVLGTEKDSNSDSIETTLLDELQDKSNHHHRKIGTCEIVK